MDKRTNEKKANIIEILAAIEDSKTINMLHAFISSYMSKKEDKEVTDVKLLTTQDIIKSEKEEAVSILEPELFQMERAIKKITSLDTEIFERYFYKYSFENNEDHYRIAFEFDRIGTYLEIVYDNVYEIRKLLGKIRGGNEEC